MRPICDHRPRRHPLLRLEPLRGYTFAYLLFSALLTALGAVCSPGKLGTAGDARPVSVGQSSTPVSHP